MKETINLAVDIILSNTPSINITKKDLTKLFVFATSQIHSLFDNYKQIDGVAMGSPLAPILANLFMGINEVKWIENYTNESFIEDM